MGAWFVLNVQWACKSFQAHPMVLLGDIGQVKLGLDLSEIVLSSRHDRCTICAKCTIGSKIALGTLDGTPSWRRSSGKLLESVWRQC
jgi:hypothetical protein